MIPLMILMIEDDSDREFIQQLFIQNERVMYKTAIGIVKDHHTACDMVAESCVTMIEKIEYLRKIDIEKQTPYILSIVKNTSLMYLRKHQKERIWLDLDEHILTKKDKFADDVEDAFISEAESQMLKSAMDRLKPREHDLLMMKYFNQLPDEEIGRQLGISRNSVRYYLTMARRAMIAELKREDDFDA